MTSQRVWQLYHPRVMMYFLGRSPRKYIVNPRMVPGTKLYQLRHQGYSMQACIIIILIGLDTCMDECAAVLALFPGHHLFCF